MLSRILTSLFLVFLAVSAVFVGGFYFFCIVLILTLISAYELINMLKNNGKKIDLIIPLLGILAGFIFCYLYQDQVIYNHLLRSVSLILIGFYIAEIFLKAPFFPNNRLFLDARIIVFFMGTMLYIFFLRNIHNGVLSLLYTALLIWTSDTFSFFGGKLFGKTHLTSISPKKTLEGSFCGIIAVVIINFILIYLFRFDLLFYTVLGLVIGILTQLGDLHESLTKRTLKTKDAGQILPGHGGMYDRIDSTLFVMPVVFYFLA